MLKFFTILTFLALPLLMGAKRLPDPPITKENNPVAWAAMQPASHKPWRLLYELELEQEDGLAWQIENAPRLVEVLKKRFPQFDGLTCFDDLEYDMTGRPVLSTGQLAGVLWVILNDANGDLLGNTDLFDWGW